MEKIFNNIWVVTIVGGVIVILIVYYFFGIGNEKKTELTPTVGIHLGEKTKNASLEGFSLHGFDKAIDSEAQNLQIKDVEATR